MHRHQLAQTLTRIRKKWLGTRDTTGPCGWSSLKVALHFDSMKSIQRSKEFQSRLSMATLVTLHEPKPPNAPFSPFLTQISFVPLLMGVIAQRQSSCGMVGSNMVRCDRFQTVNFDSKFWSRKNASPGHFGQSLVCAQYSTPHGYKKKRCQCGKKSFWMRKVLITPRKKGDLSGTLTASRVI